MRIISIFLLLLWVHTYSLSGQAKLVINELDCDTPGLDDKEFVELKSNEPNFPMDGYVLVFFNGSQNAGNTSYLALDLDGYKTDVNGIFLIGSIGVSPFPQYIIEENLIQNGADAVAIYQGDASDFLEGIVAYVDNTLIDVLMYGTNDADATGLINIFKAFNSNIAQINEGGSNNINSIARFGNGVYMSGLPTPRKPNDGSGIQLNGILVTISKDTVTEGQSFDVIFTAEQSVPSDLAIQFSLDGTANEMDFMGPNTVTMLSGQKKAQVTINLVDDNEDEGDEIMVFEMNPLPEIYLTINNNFSIRLKDNDFKISDYGSPIDPTFGKVSSSQANDYYESLDGLSGENLFTAIKNIIADPEVVRAQTYDDLIEILMQADQNPKNSHQVWLVYQEKGRSKIDFQYTSDNLNAWNREHTWPRSRGGFDSIEGDETINGKDIFWPSNADSLRHANSDAHGIRAVDARENSSRGNQFYGQYNGPNGNKGSFKGDVARGIFYLATRFNGLSLVDGFPENEVGKFGDLVTLLEWHRLDPADDYEMHRNNVIYDWQKNRNPYIDQPELVEYIWGNKQGDIWKQPTSTHENPLEDVVIFPNPAQNYIQIQGLKTEATVLIYSPENKLVLTKEVTSDGHIPINLHKGIYEVLIKTNGNSNAKKIVVQ